jgi:transcriptional regulatory protein LevR/transcriptional regulator with AAA-type ATPase domain
MKRVDKIYQYIQERSHSYSIEEIHGRIGIEAAEISQKLQILRSNVSRDLNSLYRQGKILKFSGRPVLYFDKALFEQSTGVTLPKSIKELPTVESGIASAKKMIIKKNGFDCLIGSDGSLKKQIEQAKASILYPPHGLHTLIVGQTGVGKTLFAHRMYEYGKSIGKFNEQSPFITFNCADYYTNPQLLISHIFGHVKGAFTGADSAKAGLVEAADQGILFLDEIHRLPPEGQEMLFYFMDTGTFNRLGETTRSRQASLLIIGATTEDPDSALTRTFIRRIPSIIKIQPLADRSMEEKLAIIKLLLANEVRSIQKPVKISVEAVKALIGSIGIGNIGQMKSNIKLLCAQAFLNGIDNPNYIEIDYTLLPASIKSGLLSLSSNRHELALVSEYIKEPLFISPSNQEILLEEMDDAPFNLYHLVDKKIKALKSENIQSAIIKQIVAADVNTYIKSFCNEQNDFQLSVQDRLLKIIDYDLIDFTEDIAAIVQKHLKISSLDRFLYAFSLHLSVFFKRIKSHEPLSSHTIEGTVNQDTGEFHLAMEIKQKIEKHYHIIVPPAEIEYFAMLLNSLKEEDDNEKIIITVVMHGVHTATSMTDVAQKLLNVQSENLIVFDMPIEIQPQEIFDKIMERLKAMNYHKGILLLADMGSIINFGPMITEQLKVSVKTIDMVSTPLVLEAIRKADISGISLNAVYDSLKNFKGYENSTDDLPAEHAKRPEVIVTICASGKGTAEKLQRILESILPTITARPIKVLPVGLYKAQESIQKISSEYQIIAVAGAANPKCDIPFIPLEKVINGEVENILRTLIGIGNARDPVPNKNLVLRSFCEESLIEMLTYLNPAKVLDTLLKFDSVLEANLGYQLTNPQRIRLLVHCGCALERMVLQKGLSYDESDYPPIDMQKLECVDIAAKLFENTIKISLTRDEKAFIASMV